MSVTAELGPGCRRGDSRHPPGRRWGRAGDGRSSITRRLGCGPVQPADATTAGTVRTGRGVRDAPGVTVTGTAASGPSPDAISRAGSRPRSSRWRARAVPGRPAHPPRRVRPQASGAAGAGPTASRPDGRLGPTRSRRGGCGGGQGLDGRVPGLTRKQDRGRVSAGLGPVSVPCLRGDPGGRAHSLGLIPRSGVRGGLEFRKSVSTVGYPHPPTRHRRSSELVVDPEWDVDIQTNPRSP